MERRCPPQGHRPLQNSKALKSHLYFYGGPCKICIFLEETKGNTHVRGWLEFTFRRKILMKDAPCKIFCSQNAMCMCMGWKFPWSRILPGKIGSVQEKSISPKMPTTKSLVGQPACPAARNTAAFKTANLSGDEKHLGNLPQHHCLTRHT